MSITLPHTIENGLGERITFKSLVSEPDGDRLLVESSCRPKAGPPMHVHYLQDEALTVKKGKMGYQVLGQEPLFAGEGDSIVFKRGEAHRFWNAGENELLIEGWIKPPNTIMFFLSSIYAAQKKAGNGRPEAFDSAYLLTRYKKEYDMIGIPVFVKKVIMPLTYQVGRVLGKYKKFKDAPAPL